MVVKREEVWIVQLDYGYKKAGQRKLPCVVISPDEANKYLDTVIVAPLTSTIRGYPSRVNCSFKGRRGQVVIDQIRSIEKQRLTRKLGVLDSKTVIEGFTILHEYFDLSIQNKPI